jgi:hypothetical protein
MMPGMENKDQMMEMMSQHMMVTNEMQVNPEAFQIDLLKVFRTN